jgi:hypothetical protein
MFRKLLGKPTSESAKYTRAAAVDLDHSDDGSDQEVRENMGKVATEHRAVESTILIRLSRTQ